MHKTPFFAHFIHSLGKQKFTQNSVLNSFFKKNKHHCAKLQKELSDDTKQHPFQTDARTN